MGDATCVSMSSSDGKVADVQSQSDSAARGSNGGEMHSGGSTLGPGGTVRPSKSRLGPLI